jgi:cysteinyl-tRNA synthetase
MSLKIYNTLTRKKEEFISQVAGRVHIYVCGPTVYGDPHIGHAKSYVSFDVVVRYFRYLGYRVKYVQNITDVGHLTDDADEGEDKILEQAKKEKLDPMEVAELYSWRYFDAMDRLGVIRANIFPRASGHIIEQIELIQRLLERGYAYEINGNVYFDVSSFSAYGKLSRRKIDELEAGVRIEINPEKRNPQDFSLWKKASGDHLMRWQSPWGEGYPGWHIECSTMAMKYLGETIDIHGGGLENIFPHHESEIAQSEAVTGKQFVRYWMHNNMVTVDSVKMGKSLGNFTTIEDALNNFEPTTVRFFILSSHYRSALDFSNEALEASEKGLEKLLSTIRNIHKAISSAKDIPDFVEPFETNRFKKLFEDEMNDDFNSPRAIAILFDLSKNINSYLNSETALHKPFLEENLKLFRELAGDVLGLISENIFSVKSESDITIDKVIQVTINARNKLRGEKQYELADSLRKDLNKIGIKLIDKPDVTEYELED